MRRLTIPQAAKRVGRGDATIRRWVRQGLVVAAGTVDESELLEFDRVMRENRGRPRKVEPGIAVLAEVAVERARQDAKWGEQNHIDGTGPGLVWAFTGPAAHVRETARAETDRLAAEGLVTWQDILLEEVAEAFAEADEAKLRVELIQVAAVATQWVEAIDRRVRGI